MERAERRAGRGATGSPADRPNVVPFAIMAGGWLAPLTMFWLYVWGPLRPYSYPSGRLLPGPWFVLLVVGCMALWRALPHAYFRVHGFERTGRLYERLGVRAFRHVVPDGDFVNRWVRRSVPGYRVIRGRGVAVNLYPILLQRYTRTRLRRMRVHPEESSS